MDLCVLFLLLYSLLCSPFVICVDALKHVFDFTFNATIAVWFFNANE